MIQGLMKQRGTRIPHAGLRTREAAPLMSGIMWSEPVAAASADVRHEARNEHGLSKFGWRRHDLRRFGEQEALDRGLRVTTAFVKLSGGDTQRAGRGYGGGWALQVNASEAVPGGLDAVDGMVSLFWYLGHSGGNAEVYAGATPSVQVCPTQSALYVARECDVRARTPLGSVVLHCVICGAVVQTLIAVHILSQCQPQPASSRNYGANGRRSLRRAARRRLARSMCKATCRSRTPPAPPRPCSARRFRSCTRCTT